MLKKIITLSLFSIFLAASTLTVAQDKKEDDVPVVTPRKKAQAKEDDEAPVVTPKKKGKDVDVEQAILPITLVKNKVESMRVGGTGYVSVAAVKADSERKCWIHPYSLFGVKSTEKVIQVRRDVSGFHVTVDGTEHQWNAEEFDKTNWLPIKTITVK